jgi:DnaJ-class molecular chaperone
MSKKKDGTSNKETLRRIPPTIRTIVVQCPTCRGSGKRGDRVCGLCDGEKSIRVVEEK